MLSHGIRSSPHGRQVSPRLKTRRWRLTCSMMLRDAALETHMQHGARPPRAHPGVSESHPTLHSRAPHHAAASCEDGLALSRIRQTSLSNVLSPPFGCATRPHQHVRIRAARGHSPLATEVCSASAAYLRRAFGEPSPLSPNHTGPSSTAASMSLTARLSRLWRTVTVPLALTAVSPNRSRARRARHRVVNRL